MNTLILRTITPLITSLMVIFSVFVLLRGHNEPGGGFIGGLIAAAAFALYGLACGVAPMRRALHFHPISISALGLLLAGISGLISIPFNRPFLTGLWWKVELGPTLKIALSTPLLFDIGVWLVVVGSIASIALSLEERD